MSVSQSILNEADRKRLDGIVAQMQGNNETDDAIQMVVDDFKSKYGVKKKEPSPSNGGGEPSKAASPFISASTFAIPKDGFKSPNEDWMKRTTGDVQPAAPEQDKQDIDENDPVGSKLHPLQTKITDLSNKRKEHLTLYGNRDATAVKLPSEASADRTKAFEQLTLEEKAARKTAKDIQAKAAELQTLPNQQVKQGLNDLLKQANPKSPDVDQLSIQQIEKNLPLNKFGQQNETATYLLKKLKADRDASDALQDSKTLEEAAGKFAYYYDQDLHNDVRQDFSKMPPALKGTVLSKFIYNPSVQELAAQKPQLAAAIKQGEAKLFENPQYGSFARKIIGEALGQAREQKGWNNAVGNIFDDTDGERVTANDQLFDQLVQEGVLPEASRKAYQQMRGKLHYWVPTSGGVENFLFGLKSGASNVSHFFTDPFTSGDKATQDALEKKYAQPGFKPEGLLHEVVSNTAHMTGELVPLMAISKGLSGAGLSPGLSSAIATGVVFEHPNRERAALLYPNNTAAQNIYTTASTAIDVLIGSLYHRGEALKGLVSDTKGDIGKIVKQFSQGEISEAAAKEAGNAATSNLFAKAGEFLAKTGEHNVKQTAQMAGFTLGHDIMDYALGKKDFQEIPNDVIESGKAAFMSGGLISAMAAHGELSTRKAVSGQLYNIAKNPVAYEEAIRRNPKMSEAQRDELLANIAHAKSIVADLNNETQLTEKQKATVLLHELNQKVLQDKLDNTTSIGLKERIKEQMKASNEAVKKVFEVRDGQLERVAENENSKSDNSEEIVSEKEYSDFVDKNIVSGERLDSIANKVKNRQPLSERETAIFHGKTAEINKIISSEGRAGETQGVPEAAKEPVVVPQETVREQPYQTKSGKYRVEYKEGKRVVVSKSGEPVSERTTKDVLREHDKNYNYNFGEKADHTKAPSFSNENEAKRWVVENSHNPAEVADIYLKEEKSPVKLSTKEQTIASFGIGKVTEKSYREFGDKNNINNSKARTYFSGNGRSIDVVAKEMSDHSGLNVQPQDIVDFMDRFPSGEYQALRSEETSIHHGAKERFEQLTGIPLNIRTAKVAAKQFYTPEEIREATRIVESEPMPAEELYKWLQEESDYLIHNFDTNGQDTPTDNERPQTQSNLREDTGAPERTTSSIGEGQGDFKPITEAKEVIQVNKPLAKEKATEIANRLRQWASELEGDNTTLKSDLLALPKAVLSSLLKGAANIIEVGGTIAEAIAHAVEEVKAYYKENSIEFDKDKAITDVKGLFKEIGIDTTEEIEKRITGIKNDVVKDELKRLNLEEVNFNKLSDTEIRAIGKELVDSEKIDPRAIVEQIANGKPRPLSAEETAAMVYYKTKLENSIYEAHKKLEGITKSGDEGEELVLREKLSALEQDRKQYFNMALKTGYEQSASFRLRKLILDSEFNAVHHEMKYRANNGGEIPAKVLERFKKLEQDYKDLQEKMKQFEEEKGKHAAESFVRDEIKKNDLEKRKGVRQDKVEQIDVRISEITSNIKEKFKIHRSRLNSNPVPVEIIPDLVNLAKEYIKKGIVKAEDLVDTIYTELKDDLDGISKRDLRDAISGHGKVKLPTQNEVEALLSEAKRQMQLLSALEDVQAGEKPLKAGYQRPKSSEKVKELQSKVAEAMRENNIKDTEQSQEQKLKAYRSLLEKKIAGYEQRLKEKNFSKPEKSSLALSDRELQLKAKLNRIRKDFEEEHLKLKRSQRPKWEKLLDTIAAVKRDMVISSVSTLAKLTSAGTLRQIQTPWENINGQILHIILPGLSKKATLEGGGLSLRAELEAQKKFFRTWAEGIRGKGSMWEVIKEGQSNLDEALGEQHMPDEFTSYIGRLHGALKDPVKQAEYLRAMIVLSRNAVRDGANINDPIVFKALQDQAYLKAKSSIFMNPNLATEAYRNLLNYIARKGGAKGKVLTFAAKLELPVVTVPTNFANEIMKVGFGGVHAATKTLQVLFTTGFEKMKPEDADYIMSALKKQGIGSALYAMGYLGAFAGGYYSGKRKEDDLEAGDLVVFGVRVPHLLLHSPMLEPLQMGATTKRMQHEVKLRGEDGGTSEGVKQAALGALKQVPLIETPKRLYDAISRKEGVTGHLGELVKGNIIPPDVQKIAKAMDNDEKRKPKGFVENIEVGIPGLRDNVEGAVSPKEKARIEIRKLLKEGKHYSVIPMELKKAANISPSSIREFIQDARLDDDLVEFKNKKAEIQAKIWQSMNEEEKLRFAKYLHHMDKFKEIASERVREDMRSYKRKVSGRG